MKISTFILFFSVIHLSLLAQNYQITFAATGASTTIDTIKVENLNQGVLLVLTGSDVLQFNSSPTGISPASGSSGNSIHIYPNPTSGNSTLEFETGVSGAVNIELFDLLGKKLCSRQNLLEIGKHNFQISGLGNGIYAIRVSSKDYSHFAKLVSYSTTNSSLKITYNGNSQQAEKTMSLKSACTEKLMTYNVGDRLKITGISGKYSTIVTDVPTQSKTITFNFIPCSDADGNDYPVVQIGTQTWMAGNLKTSKYNDGESLPNANEINVWAGLTSGGYCFYNNDITLKYTYGALYNWHAVNSKKLAPVGWHIPNDAEWTTLTNYLGGEATAGNKLKETSMKHWKSPSATNETGFTALPGGYRDYKGAFQNLGNFGYWWSSSSASVLSSWYRLMYYNNSNVGRYYSNKGNGYAVCCIKD